jgi:pilus assembly protein CpaE
MSFEEIDGLSEKVEIVVNRAGLDSGQISLKKAKETLGRDVFALLPNDYRTMVSVRNNGVPLLAQAPKAPITLALRDLTRRSFSGGFADFEEESTETESSDNRWAKFWPGAGKSGR